MAHEHRVRGREKKDTPTNMIERRPARRGVRHMCERKSEEKRRKILGYTVRLSHFPVHVHVILQCACHIPMCVSHPPVHPFTFVVLQLISYSRSRVCYPPVEGIMIYLVCMSPSSVCIIFKVVVVYVLFLAGGATPGRPDHPATASGAPGGTPSQGVLHVHMYAAFATRGRERTGVRFHHSEAFCFLSVVPTFLCVASYGETARRLYTYAARMRCHTILLLSCRLLLFLP